MLEKLVRHLSYYRKVVLMSLHRGVEGFWLQAGNFFQARCFSRLLALQIQAIELGLNPKDAPYPEYVHRTF